MIHSKVIINILSALVIFLGLSFFPPAIISFFFEEDDLNAFIIAISTTLVLGLIGYFSTRHHKEELRAKDGFLIVTFGLNS